MARITILVQDDLGEILQKESMDYQSDGLGTFEGLEQTVEKFKQVALGKITVGLLEYEQKQMSEKKKGKDGSRRGVKK